MPDERHATEVELCSDHLADAYAAQDAWRADCLSDCPTAATWTPSSPASADSCLTTCEDHTPDHQAR